VPSSSILSRQSLSLLPGPFPEPCQSSLQCCVGVEIDSFWWPRNLSLQERWSLFGFESLSGRFALPPSVSYQQWPAPRQLCFFFPHVFFLCSLESRGQNSGGHYRIWPAAAQEQQSGLSRLSALFVCLFFRCLLPKFTTTTLTHNHPLCPFLATTDVFFPTGSHLTSVQRRRNTSRAYQNAHFAASIFLSKNPFAARVSAPSAPDPSGSLIF